MKLDINRLNNPYNLILALVLWLDLSLKMRYSYVA